MHKNIIIIIIMPSSSTLNTVQERRFLWHYKFTVTRLHVCGFVHESAVVAGWYCDLLERSSDQLKEHAPIDQQFCEDMVADAGVRKYSENVAQVGNQTADVARLLFHYGRGEEAELFSERAAWLHDLAGRMKQYELLVGEQLE